MGTVGLSFGSPTSGAGFDVSNTVSQIVANLENVETPWKSQLTSLDNQDTALSNLGTILSNLSTDVSQLTDLTGVMAQKTGSSSDTSVLELTNATSSAVAGTHTVEVKNLATTSSGYLTALPSASTKLSGSITLQVGNGTAQTIKLSSTDNTLGGLASAINASGAGIDASVLTDASGSRLSLVSGTSGAGGTISITDNSLAAATNTAMNYTAGTSSSGTLTAIPSSSDTLSGTIAIQVGTNTAQTINVDAADNDNTLTTLADAITNAGLGVTASIVANSDGTQSLSLTTGTGGAALTVTPSLTDTSTPLAYTQTVVGANAALTVDGVDLKSTSNTVTNLIPGITFQLLAPSALESGGSLEQVQVVIGNDSSGVESTVNQFVTDYNSLISAMNTQEGNDSSGKAEPLFGSPTLALLQQVTMSGLNTQSPTGYLDGVSSSAGVTLSGSMKIQVANGTSETIQIGPGTSGDGTFYTGSDSDSDTLAGLATTINAAAASTAIDYASGSSSDAGSLTVTNTSPLTGVAPQLAGFLTIQVGTATSQTIDMSDVDTAEGGTTLSDLAGYITNNSSTLGVTASTADNGDGTSTLSLSSATLGGGALTVDSGISVPGSGVTAGVVTNNGQSSLALYSESAGANGALTVTSSVNAATPIALNYTDSGYSNTTGDSGTVSEAGTNDALTGSLTVQVGGGVEQTIQMSAVTSAEGGSTLGDLQQYIFNNSSTLGFSASLTTSSDGLKGLVLTSLTNGVAGKLTVTANLYDPAMTTTAALNYTNSSDINSLTSLGIGVNNDGTMTFDDSALDSVLNTDYSGVLGFFQDVNSWGQGFSAMLSNAGTSTPTGILALAQSSNSNTESTLNAEVTRENSMISAEQTSLTAELNSANEIMQELPSQLQGINELYAAITGYNQNTNG